jgi:hypothetical protein
MLQFFLTLSVGWHDEELLEVEQVVFYLLLEGTLQLSGPLRRIIGATVVETILVESLADVSADEFYEVRNGSIYIVRFFGTVDLGGSIWRWFFEADQYNA